VGKHRIEMVLIAIPSATGTEMTRILELCHTAGVDCRTVPGLGEMIEDRGLTGQIGRSQLRICWGVRRCAWRKARYGPRLKAGW